MIGRPTATLDGMAHPDFVPVANTLAHIVGEHAGGAAVCVYHHGVCVADLWGGDAGGAPWRRDTMAPSFSTTKGVAATVVHVMADRGLLDYDAPVAAYWPEFAQNGKGAITVRQVLAHQSGLYHIRQTVSGSPQLRIPGRHFSRPGRRASRRTPDVDSLQHLEAEERAGRGREHDDEVEARHNAEPEEGSHGGD
jgi:CubicO group peptidase (beta-lactamase class C family)